MKQLITVPVRSYRQKSWAAVGLAFLTLVLLVASAKAHALLIKSEPENNAKLEQAPDQIRAWFGEELETGLSSMQVFDLEGNQVDSGDGSVDLNDPDHASMLVSLPDSLPNGTYVVRWTVVSADDGDPTEGEFSFKVTNSGVSKSQALETGRPPAGDESDLSLGELILAGGVLLLTGLGIILYPRLTRGR